MWHADFLQQQLRAGGVRKLFGREAGEGVESQLEDIVTEQIYSISLLPECVAIE